MRTPSFLICMESPGVPRLSVCGEGGPNDSDIAARGGVDREVPLHAPHPCVVKLVLQSA